ncbi:hypothetical protein HZS_2197 [Henneguya salminicola]|nr:hypothetical protein HZS_2197 [Henneguya salminicola]
MLCYQTKKVELTDNCLKPLKNCGHISILRQFLLTLNSLQLELFEQRFRTAARRLVSLSFVPIKDIYVAFKARENKIAENLTPILNLFEDVYIRRQNRNRTRRSALFPPHRWSVYERTGNGGDRTHNYVEAAHRRLQAELGRDHSNICKFIDGIKVVKSGVTLYMSNSFVETCYL